jgi:NodT family efflux transporter outer membrane factor (OMF) lipoprotein
MISGCTGPREYFRNGFKVGPNYCRPVAPVSQDWIDSEDQRVHRETVDLTGWWHTFNDPVLNDLVITAYEQNLDVRQAAFRVLEARAILGIARGFFFPQAQFADGNYSQTKLSHAGANRNFLPGAFSNWQFGFGLAWDLDFWGKYRRTIESAEDVVESRVEDYDAVMVTLVGDVAQAYVQLRIVEQQLEYIAANTKLQQDTLDIAKARFAGGQATDLDVEQAISVLAQTESQKPQLEIQRRQLANHICVLLGMPVHDLEYRLGKSRIPSAAPEVVVGIPADLLSRRPDVRAEERRAAAECALIGRAESDLYPMISIGGELGWSAQEFSHLWTSNAFQGTVGPSFQWNLLNYGRLVNNISRVENRFEAQVAKYQQTVLQAGEEAENAIIQFLRSQQQAEKLVVSVTAAEKAVAVAKVQYQGGLVDFNRVSLIQQNLVQQQNLLAQAQGNIALGLVQVFRALGGGWEIRLNPTGSNPNVTMQSMAVEEHPSMPADEKIPMIDKKE